MTTTSVRGVLGSGSLEQVREGLGIRRPVTVRGLVERQALKMREVPLVYVGFHCFRETDGPGSDEPYFTFGVVPTLVEKKATHQTRVHDNVDAGGTRSERIELYRGPSLGVAMSVTLAEHDDGDPDKYKENVEIAVDRAAEKVIEGLAHIPVVGVPLAVIATALAVIGIPAVVEVINDLLGTDDDLVGTVGLSLTPDVMMGLIGQEKQNFFGLMAHLETPVISGDGGAYKAYFAIEG